MQLRETPRLIQGDSVRRGRWLVEPRHAPAGHGGGWTLAGGWVSVLRKLTTPGRAQERKHAVRVSARGGAFPEIHDRRRRGVGRDVAPRFPIKVSASLWLGGSAVFFPCPFHPVAFTDTHLDLLATRELAPRGIRTRGAVRGDSVGAPAGSGVSRRKRCPARCLQMRADRGDGSEVVCLAGRYEGPAANNGDSLV